MDSLTQIVLGAGVGEAILGKKVGNKAMIWGAIAGTIPDLDVFASFIYDPLTATEIHRGFSHSIIFSMLLAPVLGWLAFKIHKNESASIKSWSWMMFGSLVTHPMLDAHTAFGTQLFWPLEYKITYNNIFVVDPLYTLPFMIFLILAMRLKRDHPRRRLFSNIALIVSSGYMILTFAFKYIAQSHFISSMEANKIQYNEIESKPTPFNAILWCGFIQTDSSFLLSYYSLLDEDEHPSFTTFPKKHYLLAEKKNDPTVHRLIKLTRGWYNLEVVNDTLVFYDLRFGQMGFSNDPTSFVASYQLYYKNGNLVAMPTKRNMNGAKEGFIQLFHRLKGNKKG